MLGSVIQGRVGVVKWSYYNAAGIEGYVLRRDDDKIHWALKANVIVSDSFKLRQRPLIFEAPTTHWIWRLPIAEFSITEGVMTARLGRLEQIACRSASSVLTPAR